MTRDALLAALAELLPPGPARVGVDGPDTAGKTVLAGELGAELERRGRRVARLSGDDFLRPPEERYRRGTHSPEGYHLDAFDITALRRAVSAWSGDVLIVDGVFLFRPELVHLWDVRVYLDCAREEILRRASRRDADHLGDAVVDRYLRRYLPAYDRYREEVGPAELADAVVDNTEPLTPSLRSRSARRTAVESQPTTATASRGGRARSARP